MDFSWSDEEKRFRQSVCDFIEANWTDESGDEEDQDGDEGWQRSRAFEQALAANGWLTMAWPKEYGGQGASPIEQMIFKEEAALHSAPIGGSGVSLLGPTLMIYGTEEQRNEHIPKIASGEVVWAQGYSEPGSGSDLASLQTRAVRDGDEYVINGQKIWTSGAHHADWIHVLTRSDADAPKHRGISYFMLDMKTPGITVRPLIQMHDVHSFNETFFEDVRVPAANLIGEENRGWYVATTTLDFERSGVGRAAGVDRAFQRLLTHVAGRRRRRRAVQRAATRAGRERGRDRDQPPAWLPRRVDAVEEPGAELRSLHGQGVRLGIVAAQRVPRHQRAGAGGPVATTV